MGSFFIALTFTKTFTKRVSVAEGAFCFYDWIRRNAVGNRHRFSMVMQHVWRDLLFCFYKVPAEVVQDQPEIFFQPFDVIPVYLIDHLL